MSQDFNPFDQEEKEQAPQVKEKHEKKKKDASLSKMLFSGVAGGLIVALFSGGIFISILDDQESNSTDVASNSTEQTESSSSDQESVPTTNIANEEDEATTTNNAIQQVSDAVVGVSNIQQVNLWEESNASGTGSGVIYKKEGDSAYVVTNNHVVEGAQEVQITLTNGEQVKAEILGTDQLTDLAVLKIPGDQVETVATLGSSSDVGVGQTAIAIGNPLGQDFAGSVTKGIISGVERSVDVDLNGDNQPDWTTEVLQTDAAINPGNSGGALINSKGEVIGINSMKIALESVEGIGFAIPIDDAKPVIEQLETDGEVVRPFVGISAVDLSTVPEQHRQQTLNLSDDVQNGLVVAQVQSGSPAANAGLQQYDVVTAINDKQLESMLDLKTYLYNETEIGEEVTVTFYRDGEKQTVNLTLSEQGNL
ncbi:S1C family serine protease [Gracilibacillus caseinilyticus]|uniref:S1C family serine protease n=1 Tax=Gracilibacillus caseinilyticus TaxID=2932256 RepID=A0ABY4EXK6_9BACI|nr:S1C family serine protease [Gracilibacillus caseinilyticus]UOQ49149.1 S1C family serine protease [Gracilibacillus caseinilyticus]